MATFASSATTVVSNIQSTALSSMIGVINAIEGLQRLLQNQERGELFDDFIAPEEIKQDAANDAGNLALCLQNLLSELENIKEDIELINDRSESAKNDFISEFESIQAQVLLGANTKVSREKKVLALVNKARSGKELTESEKTTLAEAGVDVAELLSMSPLATTAKESAGAEAASIAFAQRAEYKRKEQEVEVFERAASSKFYRVPGTVLSDILTIREKTAEQVGEYVSKAFVSENSLRAQLYVQWATNSYAAAASIASQYADFSIACLRVLAQLFAEYDKSTPLELEARKQKIISANMNALLEGGKLAKRVGEVQADYYWFDNLREPEVKLMMERFKADIYKAKVGLLKNEDAAVAAAMASAIRSAGEVASRALGAIGASGSFTERGFA